MRGRWSDLIERVPCGSAPLAILLATVVAAAWLALGAARPPHPPLRVWTFAREHRQCYDAVAADFMAQPGHVAVSVEHVEQRAIEQRMRAAMRAGLDVPEIVDVEITAAGSFFAGPVDDVGFLDLKPLLERDGIYDSFLPTRLAPYTNRGRIFGLPHDIHPVMLAYRRDVFAAEGIDPETIRTWEDLVAIGRRLTRQPAPGRPARFLLQLPSTQGWGVELLMFQRGGGYFAADGRLTMDDEVVAQTVEWYVPLIADTPERIGFDCCWGNDMVQSISDGFTLMFICPDWRAKKFANDTKREDGSNPLAGKMALMPLPAVTPGGRRTSTWGGTMMGISKRCAHPDQAWALIRTVVTSERAWRLQYELTGILPAVRGAWTQPALSVPDPFWSYQAVGAAYAALAPDVPPQHGSPYLSLAKAKLSEVVSRCGRYYETSGRAGFAGFVRQSLHEAAEEVRRHMRRNPF